jgi:hypothetical protein
MKKPGTSIHHHKKPFFVISKKKGFFFLLLLVASGVALVSLVFAAVPPPPVNQLLGIRDSVFDNPVTDDCRFCHDQGNGPVDGVCSVSGTACSVDQNDPQSTCPNAETCLAILAKNRHHLLVGDSISTGSLLENPELDPPIWADDADGDGNPDTNYACENCHPDDPNTPVIEFVVTGDCLKCHIYDPDSRPSTPHHITQDALDRHCSFCHGSLVQDFDDDHYIPDYDISDVTPDPVCKTWDGPICVSGGCFVCHTEDTVAVPPVARYNKLHHATRLDCSLCHSSHSGIRLCQTCHSVDSLHNIQADSDNQDNLGTIIPGEENLGWGHIGNGWDCFGCHESFMNGNPAATSSTVTISSTFTNSNTFMNSVTPQTGATVPTISDLSAYSVIAGQETEVSIYGNGFINSTDGITLFTPDVVLESSTMTVTLGQTSLTEGEITVTVPSTLPSGLYDLRVLKDDKKSNPVVINVIPGVEITDVRCRGNKKRGYTLTITGAGFGNAPPAGSGDYLNVLLNGVVLDSTITWEDTEITAGVSRCPSTSLVNVNALFGSDTAQATTGKIKKPKK